jgi:hypothetical protein
MKIFTGEHLKTHSGIPHQINNSKGWYQNVLFGGSVLNPRYKVHIWSFNELSLGIDLNGTNLFTLFLPLNSLGVGLIPVSLLIISHIACNK